ncbi:MAG: iron ABC transporter permease [bacterium]
MRRREKNRILAIFALIVILILVSAFSLVFGAVVMSPGEVWNAISCNFYGVCDSMFTKIVVWEVRLPRIVTAAFVGLLLAVSGTILQGVLRNPLADPYILGISAGAGVGAALAIALGISITAFGFSSTAVFAFVFSLITVFLVYSLSKAGGVSTPETLILAGVAVSAFSSAILALIMIFSGDLQSIYFWLLGGFSGADWSGVFALLPYVIIGSIIAYYFSKELNALLLGEELAKTLGVDIEKVRIILLCVASFMTAAAVSVSGLIGFIGLMVPHFVRLLVGPHYRLLVPISALVGMLLMVIADTIARSIIPPIEIPVGIIMALFGAPFFLYVLRSRRRSRN